MSFLKNGITAHRGDCANAPENTLSAFQAGLVSGADWIELDVHQTADGHLVVIHDATTGRTGDVDLVVGESSLADLHTVDVAYSFRCSRPKEDVPREHLPTLNDVLELMLRQNQCRMSVQPKSDCLAEIFQLLKRRDALRFAGINDGSLPLMEKARLLSDRLPLFWDCPANCDLETDIPIAKSLRVKAMVLEHSGATKPRLEKIQNAGMQAGAWTVNDADDLRRLAEWKADRIYTDFPQLGLATQRAVAANGLTKRTSIPLLPI